MSESPFDDRFRRKAERHIVFPLNRDECLALVEVAEAAHRFNTTGPDGRFAAIVDLDAALFALNKMPFETQAVHP